ncbi:MAG: cation:dicarboxylase symporter family transporter [Nitrospira sp.]|nr:cation:dicarboxylase symporter family transporter [Nitrospira sp.]
MATSTVTPAKILQLGTGFWGSKTLLSAIELGVFTELGKGALDGEILRTGKQLVIVVASIIAGAGVAGIPEAGMIIMPLVLTAAGLPDEVILASIPLIMTVDWIIARARSAVNVMSDMLVAILLDAGLKTTSHK